MSECTIQFQDVITFTGFAGIKFEVPSQQPELSPDVDFDRGCGVVSDTDKWRCVGATVIAGGTATIQPGQSITKGHAIIGITAGDVIDIEVTVVSLTGDSIFNVWPDDTTVGYSFTEGTNTIQVTVGSGGVVFGCYNEGTTGEAIVSRLSIKKAGNGGKSFTIDGVSSSPSSTPTFTGLWDTEPLPTDTVIASYTSLGNDYTDSQGKRLKDLTDLSVVCPATSDPNVGIPPFTSTIPDIVAKYPLTSNDASGLGGGVLRIFNGTTFEDSLSTAEFDPVAGFTSDGTKHLFWDSNLIPNIPDLDSGWSIIFEIKTADFFNKIDNTTGASNPVYWSTTTNTAGTDGFLRWYDLVTDYVAWGIADAARMDPNFSFPSYMADNLIVPRDSEYIRFCVSMSDTVMEFYANDHMVSRADGVSAITPSAFLGFWICSREGNAAISSDGFVGTIRNLMVLKRPIIFPEPSVNPKILLVGDSIFAAGNHTNTGVQCPYKAEGDIGTSLGQAGYYDAGISSRLQNILLDTERQRHRVYDVAIGGYTITRTGNGDIVFQTDGTNAPYDLATIAPFTTIILGGTNDANSIVGPLDSVQFETDYREIVTNILNSPNTTGIVFCTIPSMAADTSTDPDEIAATHEVNRIITLIYNDYKVNRPDLSIQFVDLFSLFGGDTPDITKFLPNNLHPNGRGNWFMGEWIAAVLRG